MNTSLSLSLRSCPILSPTTALNLRGLYVCTAAESLTPGKGDQTFGNYSHLDSVRAYLATIYSTLFGMGGIP